MMRSVVGAAASTTDVRSRILETRPLSQRAGRTRTGKRSNPSGPQCKPENESFSGQNLKLVLYVFLFGEPALASPGRSPEKKGEEIRLRQIGAEPESLSENIMRDCIVFAT